MADEPRRYQRSPARSLVAYVHLAPDGSVDDRGMGTLYEISLAGVGFEAPRAYDDGSRMDLEVQLRNDIVKLTGTVVRSSAIPAGGYQIGLSIDRASPSFAELLREYFGS